MIELTVDTVLTRSDRVLAPSTPIEEAAQTLRDPEVSALVVFEDDALVGIVTESDFVACIAEASRPARTEALMSSPVITVTPDTSVTAAGALMRERGVRHLAVVDGEGIYCGLLSAATLALYLSPHSLDIDWNGDPLRLDVADDSPLPADE
ncbi:CBS domain-containing protein [Halalkalicoccus jeotgali]|uniref:Signal transduction protein with CBS domains n=1 Tax=Halalkalicoccus jeotgali (strain DSM 18796 / CECT 7217 / JCM 14584 / KCTC 4019 / B3) TaxID=795797 RepID=D8J7X9_HALJB|nr:CBS domain-containing protein [Halalkalicoccus jeotgali]ADJ14092.1 putative signal transduction protein with CBS domains [Halalkalicoccus jeotgali B3]ELY34478.1 putative signal transduction protein with CBS domains [Halalkalicoccus jeotgali B3]